MFLGLRSELDLVVADGFDSALSKWFNGYEPLFFEKGFDDGAALITVADGVDDFGLAAAKSLLLEVYENLLTGLVDGHSLVFLAGFGGELAIEPDDADQRYAVTFAEFVVVLVVSGSDFDGASAVIAVDIGVGDDRNVTISQR